jgi:hypothetical protein
MRRPHNCVICGKPIIGIKYNPYNRTFDEYACKLDEKKMCLKCAECFID